MKNCAIRLVVLALIAAGVWSGPYSKLLAQEFGPDSDALSGGAVGRRPMTFADLERMKRVSDPQVSPSGKWVMFSVTDVDLEKNSKVNHLWVVPMATPPLVAGQSAGPGTASNVKERQLTFWKDGESGGRFSPDGKQVAFVATDSSTGAVADLSCGVGRWRGDDGDSEAVDECEYGGRWGGVVTELKADSVCVADLPGVQR
jgi:hypothetical protein